MRSPYSWRPPCPPNTGKSQNHSGYVSAARPYVQNEIATTNVNVAHGKCSSAYSRWRQDAPLLRIAPIHDMGPPVLPRTGSGSATSTRSSPRARCRSSAPKPRQTARPTARTGIPMKVTSRPALIDVMVTAKTNITVLSGKLSSA